MWNRTILRIGLLGSLAAVPAEGASENELRDAYFGNFHVHTSYSFDGYTNGCVTGPRRRVPLGQGGGDPGTRLDEPDLVYALSRASAATGDPKDEFTKGATMMQPFELRIGARGTDHRGLHRSGFRGCRKGRVLRACIGDSDAALEALRQGSIW